MDVEEIKHAIKQLPKDQKAALVVWMASLDVSRHGYDCAIYALEDDVKALDERLKKLEQKAHPAD